MEDGRFGVDGAVVVQRLGQEIEHVPQHQHQPEELNVLEKL